jgi:hypothetical protein
VILPLSSSLSPSKVVLDVEVSDPLGGSRGVKGPPEAGLCTGPFSCDSSSWMRLSSLCVYERVGPLGTN